MDYVLIEALQGKNSIQGGLDLEGLKNSLTRVDPDNEPKIRRMERYELQSAYEHLIPRQEKESGSPPGDDTKLYKSPHGLNNLWVLLGRKSHGMSVSLGPALTWSHLYYYYNKDKICKALDLKDEFFIPMDDIFLLGDLDLVQRIIKTYPHFYYFLPREYKNDYEISILAVEGDINNLNNVLECFYNDRDFMQRIYAINPDKAEQFVGESLLAEDEYWMYSNIKGKR